MKVELTIELATNASRDELELLLQDRYRKQIERQITRITGSVIKINDIDIWVLDEDDEYDSEIYKKKPPSGFTSGRGIQ